MGSKPSHAMQSNRPESGGANHDDQQEKSGLLEREKQEFAKSEQAQAIQKTGLHRTLQQRRRECEAR